MYRENKRDFDKVLQEIQSKLPGIQKIEPLKLENGQITLRFWEEGFREPFFSPRMSDICYDAQSVFCKCTVSGRGMGVVER